MDIDGVFNSISYEELNFVTEYFDVLDPSAIKILNWVCRKIPDLEIVISSTWRKHSPLSEIQEKFFNKGFRYIDKMIDVTGRSPKGFRGDEVDEYLNKHGITNYCIIDDDCDFHPHQHDRFVHINNVNGITFLDATKIITILDPNNECLDPEILSKQKWQPLQLRHLNK